jgi:NifB/MoaA-like Fe-S oxidoreductase
VTAEIARAVLEQIGRHQRALLARIGSRFVFAADEFFLRADLPIPPAEEYEEFGMIEDGIGMVRRFVDGFEAERKRRSRKAPALGDLTVVTGTLFAPVLAPLLRRVERELGLRLRLLPVENRFLGRAVEVAGLLPGADIVRALRGAGAGGIAVLSSEAVSRANGLLIDDYTPERVRSEGGLEQLCLAEGPAGFFRILREGPIEGTGKGSYGG